MVKMQDTMIPLAVFLGILATLMMNLGKGTSKYGLKYMAEKRDQKKKYGAIWIIGIIITALNVVPQYFGVDLGGAALITSMAGIGLVAIIIFSYFVLDEKLDKIVYSGIGFTIFGTVLVGIFSVEPIRTHINYINFAILFSIVLIPIIIAIVYSHTHDNVFFGFLYGTMAGVLSGLAVVLMNMGQILFGGANNLFVNLLSIGNIVLYLAIIMALVATAFTQYGLTKGKASIVAPAYNSAYIIIPVISEMLVFYFFLSIWQLIGVILIIIGVVLMTAFKSEPLDISPLDKSEKENQTL